MEHQHLKVRIGKLSPKDIAIPNVKNIMEHPIGESLMIFGTIEYENETYRQLYGVGVVWKIKHSEKYDCVYMRFGNISKIILSKRILTITER